VNWLRKSEVAKKLGVSVGGLALMMAENPEFPKATKVSPKVTVFLEEEVEEWMKLKMQTSNQEV
jgi:predicted DNA-binding transcriptional regulator AlpA